MSNSLPEMKIQPETGFALTLRGSGRKDGDAIGEQQRRELEVTSPSIDQGFPLVNNLIEI